jgi:hypothetical protein
MGSLDGLCEIAFKSNSDETKLRNVFKVKKCFRPFRSDVKTITGNFVKSQLEVKKKISQ